MLDDTAEEEYEEEIQEELKLIQEDNVNPHLTQEYYEYSLNQILDEEENKVPEFVSFQYRLF